MSASKQFSVKRAVCEAPEVYSKTKELESEWIVALLRRLGIPKLMINKALTDTKFGAQAWRNYLFDSKGLQITHHAALQRTEIFKVDLETGKKTKIGQWSKPEIIRVKRGGKVECELHLKYWQIL